MKNLLLFFLITSLAACSFFKKKPAFDKDIVARANEEYLYASDMESLTKGLQSKDSLDVLKSYAENWVRRKLLLQKAVENIPADDISITKKIEDYREELVLYEYEKALINRKLDTVIRAEELDKWYEKLKADFPLESNVYLLYFIKLKKDAPDLKEARKWILNPKDEEDSRKLEGYSKEFAISYVMDKGMWYTSENVLKNFPLSENDIASLSNSKAFREFKTEEGSCFIRIADQLKKDDPSPLEFIREPIVKAIIEKRRLALVEKVYNKIYQDGIKSKSFEVFVKQP